MLTCGREGVDRDEVTIPYVVLFLMPIVLDCNFSAIIRVLKSRTIPY